MSDSLNRVEDLILQGQSVRAKRQPTHPNVMTTRPKVDECAFTKWKTQSLTFLQSLQMPEHMYVEDFKKKVVRNYISEVDSGIGILEALKEDMIYGSIPVDPNNIEVKPLTQLEQLFTRFHLVARQLLYRHQDRETLKIADEYDVQDLLHSLLVLFFEDVRPEESTRSYAGKSSRIDFILKNENIGVEVKKTRASLTASAIGKELAEDIERYKTHPNCKMLVCFVYDPDMLVSNPRGWLADKKVLSSAVLF